MGWAHQNARPLEFESPKHMIGDILARQAMFGLPHTQPGPQRVRIAALRFDLSAIDALIDFKVHADVLQTWPCVSGLSSNSSLVKLSSRPLAMARPKAVHGNRFF
jgi:hypothetical protein